ncbi:MAG: cell division protein FtsQ [Actinomycetota bacterium]|jgi:cell division protein FtsQ|nr:cell division protein FtsQ [Actinomycetota bacterium]
MLDVREIQVTGSKHVNGDDVESVALVRGDNLLTLSTAHVVERVETLPWVKSARVERRLPGTIRIRIEERRPAMILSLGEARWTLDAHGRVLQPGIADKGLPVLGGVAVGDVAPGASVTAPEARDALAAWRGLPASLRRQVIGIFAPTVERLTLSLDDGTLIRYGAAEAMEAKNEVLRSLLADLAAEGRNASYIDLRVPTSPAVSAVAPASLTPPSTSTTSTSSTDQSSAATVTPTPDPTPDSEQ